MNPYRKFEEFELCASRSADIDRISAKKILIFLMQISHTHTIGNYFKQI
jgi:hypothetical protein